MNPRSYVRKAAGLAVLLVALLLGTAAPASAHAALIRADPADGSVVRTAPQRVVLTFSEGVLLGDDSLRVLDPRGANVAVGTPGHADGPDSGSTATIALRAGLGDGTYTVAWRAVSQDSHPVAGAFTFSVGAASKTTVDLSGAAAAGGGAATTLYGIGRYFAYAGFALMVGASVFLGVCWPRGALLRPMQALAAAGWGTLLLATIALLALRGSYVTGKGLGKVFDLNLTGDQLATRPGAALLSRLLLLAAASLFLAVLFGSYAKREDPEERADLAWGLGIGGTVVAAGIAATWAMAEHASVGEQRRIAMPVDVVHLLSMAVWLGGLIALLTALWAPSMTGRDRQVPPYAVRRFSALALTSITLLVGTGVYQAWRQVGTWRAFTDTSYGRLLLIKIGLVCALVGVAWFSRRWTASLGQTRAAAAAAPRQRNGRGRAGAGATAGAGVTAGGASGAGAGLAEGVGAAEAAGAAGSTGTGGGAATATVAAESAGGASGGSGATGGASGGASGGPDGSEGSGGPDGSGGPLASGSDAGGTAGGDGQGVAPGAEAGASGRNRGPEGAGRGVAPGADADPDPASAAGSNPAPSAGDGGPSSARAAQLRRQQAARSAAKARKALDADPARGALRGSVLAEAGIAVVLLAVTTILSGSQPGRAAEEQKGLADAPPSSTAAGSPSPSSTAAPAPIRLAVPYDTGGPKGRGTAGATLAPGRAGTANTVRVLLTGPDGRPVDVPEVRVAFTLPAQRLGPIPVSVHRVGAGDWTADGVQLPLPGAWQLSVTVRTSAIDEVTEIRNVKVGS